MRPAGVQRNVRAVANDMASDGVRPPGGRAMKRKRFTEEQIVGTLKKPRPGRTAPISAGGGHEDIASTPI